MRHKQHSSAKSLDEWHLVVAQHLFFLLHHLTTHPHPACPHHSLHPPLHTQPPLVISAPHSSSHLGAPSTQTVPCCCSLQGSPTHPHSSHSPSSISFHPGPESAMHFHHSLSHPPIVLVSPLHVQYCSYTHATMFPATSICRDIQRVSGLDHCL